MPTDSKGQGAACGRKIRGWCSFGRLTFGTPVGAHMDTSTPGIEDAATERAPTALDTGALRGEGHHLGQRAAWVRCVGLEVGLPAPGEGAALGARRKPSRDPGEADLWVAEAK